MYIVDDMKINNCLKEWNAIVEALGQGRQTILIRSYGTNISQFLLYPTFTYAKRNYKKRFNKKELNFVENNLFPNVKNDRIMIKYFVKIEDIIRFPILSLDEIENLFIWDKEHVKTYLRENDPFLWLIRVYQLEKHIMVDSVLGHRYAKLNDYISLSNSKMVLDNNEYQQIINQILDISKKTPNL